MEAGVVRGHVLVALGLGLRAGFPEEGLTQALSVGGEADGSCYLDIPVGPLAFTLPSGAQFALNSS